MRFGGSEVEFYSDIYRDGSMDARRCYRFDARGGKMSFLPRLPRDAEAVT